MTISARIVADSVSPQGHRLTSVQVTAHRFILAEINTHKRLSRSYRSSRAVPVKKLLEEVRTNPAMPIYWGANEPGMQASGELSNTPDGLDVVMCSEANDTGWSGHEWRESNPLDRAKWQWGQAAKSTANYAEDLAKNGLHKQIANRVLEPFLWVHGIITATEFDNFFGLRLHHAAQPEFRVLADAMWAEMKASTPRQLEPGANWHLPYFEPEDWNRLDDYASRTNQYDRWMTDDKGYSGSWAKDLAVQVSVARCAWNSYNSFVTGKRSTPEEAFETYAKLNIPGTDNYDPTQPIHASPAEHQGTPDDVVPATHNSEPIAFAHPDQHGNFVGFRQFRKLLPGEAVAPLPAAYR